jgi:hypothetical protein
MEEFILSLSKEDSPPITERDAGDLSLRPFFHLQKHLHDDAQSTD